MVEVSVRENRVGVRVNRERRSVQDVYMEKQNTNIYESRDNTTSMDAKFTQTPTLTSPSLILTLFLRDDRKAK
jgi:hypothetical protein